jgi:hypothetical protein
MGSLEEEITSLMRAMLRPFVEKSRKSRMDILDMERTLLRTSDRTIIDTVENNGVLNDLKERGVQVSTMFDSVDTDPRFLDIMRRHGPHEMLAISKMASKVAQEFKEQVGDVPDVRKLIALKKQDHPDAKLEYAASEVLRLQKKVYENLKSVAELFRMDLRIIAKQLSKHDQDPMRHEARLSELRETHKKAAGLLLKQLDGDNIVASVLGRIGIPKGEYDVYMLNASNNEPDGARRELDDAIKLYSLASAGANEAADQLDAEIRDRMAGTRRALATGYSDHGSHSSSGESYFGTVHGSGRCRRSTSFGKYVLSLS